MKRVLLQILALALLLAACGNTSSLDQNVDDEGQTENEAVMLNVGTVCHADVVNVRMEPDASGRIIDTASRGELFEVINYAKDKDWQEVRCQGERAYISSEYLYVVEWNSAEQFAIGTVSGSSGMIKIYNIPSREGTVVLTAFKGAKFMVTSPEAENGWYKVGFPEGVGYIEEQNLQVQTTTLVKALS